MQCQTCGTEYDKFRTGFTFAEVRSMMYVASADPKDWRHKRRHSVLGFWHQLKKELWGYHLHECEMAANLARLHQSDESERIHYDAA